MNLRFIYRILEEVRNNSIFKRLFFSSHPLTEKIKRNLFSAFFIKAISILIGLFYIPFLYGALGATEYGIFLAITSVFNWLSFFDIGLSNGLRNRFAEAKSKGLILESREFISTTYFFLILIFGTLYLIYLGTSIFIDWSVVLLGDSKINSKINILFNVIAASVCLRFIFQTINSIYLANQDSAMPGVLGLVSNVVSLLIILLFSYYDFISLLSVGTVLSIVPVVVFAFFSVYSFTTKYIIYRPAVKLIKIKLYDKLFNLGWKFFILQMSTVIIYSTTNFLILRLFSAGSVADYNVGRNYFSVVQMVFGIIITPFWSANTMAYYGGDFDWIINTMKKLRHLAFYSSFVVILMMIAAPYVIEIWMGGRVHLSHSLIVVQGISVILYMFFSPFPSFLNGIGKVQLNVVLVVFQMLVFFPLVYIICVVFKVGIEGVILASILCELPLRFSQPIQYQKIMSGRAVGIWNK